ncbi:MAG: RNA polymerase sigma factor [Bacteroidales bacterium]|jgi:DNA-directed RNA polymerase specialized sigma24 family protein
MCKFTNEEVINALRKSDTTIIQSYFYKKCYPSVEYHVLSNNGTKNDAKDIFQDALLNLINIVENKKDYHFNCTVKTLFVAIARNLWLRRINSDKKVYKDCNVKIENLLFWAYEPEINYLDKDKFLIDEFSGVSEKVIFDIAKQISDDCYSILVSTDSINRKKKYQYKQKIRKILKKHI